MEQNEEKEKILVEVKEQNLWQRPETSTVFISRKNVDAFETRIISVSNLPKFSIINLETFQIFIFLSNFLFFFRPNN
jgi:hypothetical protein